MRLETKETAATTRSRASSLDFTAKRGLSTTTKPMKRKVTNASPSTAQSPVTSSFLSRARGGSGPPPQSFLTLADLDGLSEAEILQVLYENPHLAREAAQLVESKDYDEAAAQPLTSTGNRARLEAGRSPTSPRGPRQPREISQQQRIPVLEWVMVLLLLGVVAYQLRKAIHGPDKRGKKIKSKKVTAGKPASIPEVLLEENVGPGVGVKRAKQIKNRKPSPPQTKKKKSKSTAAKEEPPSSSKASSKPAPWTPTSFAVATTATPADDSTGWQTVSKDKFIPVQVNSSSSETAVEERAALIEPSQKENLQPPSSNTDHKSLTKKKEKKIKLAYGKLSTESYATPETTETRAMSLASTDQDEDLANRMQHEENMAAAGSRGKPIVGTGWEEVRTRNGKRDKETAK